MKDTTVRIRKKDSEVLKKITKKTKLPRWVIISQALTLYEEHLLPRHEVHIYESERPD